MIKESIDDVDKLIDYLSKKIETLREKNPKIWNDPKFKTIIEYISKFYNEVVLKWQDKYWFGENTPSKDEEQEMNDMMLDIINIIDKFVKKYQ